MEKSPTFFGKTPTFFKKSPTFFLERRRYYPQSEKRDIGRRGVKVVKAKSAKSQGRRARHTRVRKTPYEGGQNGTKATCHFIRQSSEGNTQVMEQNIRNLQSEQSIFAYTKRKNCTFSAIFISLPHLAPI